VVCVHILCLLIVVGKSFFQLYWSSVCVVV
jgi:hypothetical protein